MKIIFICCLALLSGIAATGQQKSSFLVEYFYEQTSFLPDSVLSKKIDIGVLYVDSNGHETNTITTGSLIPGDLKFQTIVFIIASPESSKTFFLNLEESIGGVTLVMNTPDTLYYTKGVWIKNKDGVNKPLVSISVSVAETKETKSILGYQCVKFVSTDREKGKEIIFWASKKLPDTLLPYTGLEKFKYGILEIYDLQNNWHTVARKIKEL